MTRSLPHHIGIIGGGPAGLTAAYVLAQRGIKVTVFEASDAVGGMARTIDLWGQLVDLGPHRFFSSDPRVNRIWLDVMQQDYSMVSRLTRIHYRGKFFDYPLKAFNALAGLGPWEALRCLFSYVQVRLAPARDERTFEAWVSNRFGHRLFSIFFKSYSEKLWGIPCTELDADFAAQRIRKLSLMEAIKAMVMDKRKQRHKTLVDEFAYPNAGTGQVYMRMAERIRAMGGDIRLGSPVHAIRIAAEGRMGVEVQTADGKSQSCDHVVSSMPITQLVEHLGAPEEIRRHAKALRFRNTILIYLRLEGENPFPDQWIYVHSPEIATGRITNFRNWVPSLARGCNQTILCMEYWCFDEHALWHRSELDLINLARDDIARTGLVPKAAVREGKVIRLPKCYPVYAAGYRTHLKPIERYLSQQPGLSVIGRYGAFKYNNQNHSMLMGLLAAENIADGASHDLWVINTDYEYQEASRITATGLMDSNCCAING
jgi:protoporphyrinogen oxidase